MENSSQPTKVSTLEQLRQRRQSPGVINTESFHCHYQGIKSTTGQLLQRAALPKQIQFRYETRSSHPVALVYRLYRRRRTSTESIEQGSHPSFPNPDPITPSLIPSPQTFPSRQLQDKPQPTSIKTQSPKTVKVFTQTPTVNPQQQAQTNAPKSMQINHQKTLNLVNQKSSVTPKTLQAQPTTNPKPSLSPSESNPTLSAFRVRRPTSLFDGNPRQLQGTTPQSIQPQKTPHPSAPISSRSLPLVQRKAEGETSQSSTMSPSSLSPNSAPISQKTNHGALLTASVSPIKVQPSASYQPTSLQPKPFPLSSTQRFPTVTAGRATSNPSLSSTLRQTSTLSKPDHIQSLPLATPQPIVSTSLTIPSKQPTASPYSSTLGLPLAITQSKTTNSIARQPMLNGSSSPTTRQTTTTQSMSVSEPTTNPIDIAKVAQQVSRILGRQLQVEQERRGYKR